MLVGRRGLLKAQQRARHVAVPDLIFQPAVRQQRSKRFVEATVLARIHEVSAAARGTAGEQSEETPPPPEGH
eukprot:5313086-Prymnesium_polylepis.2